MVIIIGEKFLNLVKDIFIISVTVLNMNYLRSDRIQRLKYEVSNYIRDNLDSFIIFKSRNEKMAGKRDVRVCKKIKLIILL